MSQLNAYGQLRLDFKQIRGLNRGFWVSIGVVYANGGDTTQDGVTARIGTLLILVGQCIKNVLRTSTDLKLELVQTFYD